MAIILLDTKTINRIAAGEVIERPASVVKELVENAIDAGSSEIEIKIESGGRNLVTVTDDGHGIEKDDLELAFMRHATSKLSDSELIEIKHLGFRGEALPSIAAVSRIKLLSRIGKASEAWFIRYEGGEKIGELMPYSLLQGTNIEVRDLFFATPNRLNFLKTERAETQAIVDIVNNLAMINYRIGFSLTSGNKKLLKYAKQISLFSRLCEIEEEFQGNSLEVNEEENGVRLTGHICKPTVNRGKSDMIYTFVNGRPIKDNLLIGAIRYAYHDFIPSDRYPFAALHLEVPYDQVDVNVHPNKSEVRFQNKRLIYEIVRRGLIKALSTRIDAVHLRVIPAHDRSAGTTKNPDPFSKSNVQDSYKGYAKGLLQGVRALLTLYVIFTVVGYMLGMIQLSKFDFIVRIMKIAFIAFALSDRSWELFGMTLSKFFVDGSTHLVDSFSGYIGEGGRKFAFLDLTAGVLFTGETWLKFLSLMLAGPFGFIAFLIILHASFMFLKCIISATFRYVISTVLMAFLLSLTPLFIVFILFQQTKSLFDNWIKTLAHVAVQPVILFSSLSLLNQLMYSVLYNLTNFSACYQCLISVNFLSYDVCLIKSILPLGYSPGTIVDVALSTGERTGGHFAALPIDLIQAFIYLIIASAMEVFVSVSETMAQALFGSGFGVAQSVGKVARSASQAMLSAVGLDDETQGMIQRTKQEMGKDRTQIDVKATQSETQSGKQGDPGQTKDGSSSVSKKLGQQDKKKHSGKAPDKTEAEDEKKD